MDKVSAGILPYRIIDTNKPIDYLNIAVFLVHPGGPYYRNKDYGWWSIPKGHLDDGEQLISTAIREFKEEVNYEITDPRDLVELGSIKQKGGKIVHAWAFKIIGKLKLNTETNLAEVEWPPRSGKKILIPENDKGMFFNAKEARLRINDAQSEFIERLVREIA